MPDESFTDILNRGRALQNRFDELMHEWRENPVSSTGWIDSERTGRMLALAKLADEIRAAAQPIIKPADDYPHLNLDGVVHRLRVYPNENRTGWLFDTRDQEHTLVNVDQADAERLAALLIAGPGEPKWECERHRKIAGNGPCLYCLRGDD